MESSERGQAISDDRMALIKKTVASDLNKDELALFINDCERRGVDPLDRLLHPTVHVDRKTGKRRYTLIAGIDFMRSQASKTGEYLGSSLPSFDGNPGKPGFVCTVHVKRWVKGLVGEFSASVAWEEFYPGDAKGFMWNKMPRVMLAKVAESHALRKGFPAELSGLYTHEEMSQAGTPEEGPNLTKAMTAAFPPGEENSGLLLAIEPPDGTNPPIARIQTLDGILGFHIFGDESRFASLVQKEVIYKYGKNGKFRPIEAMRLKPIEAKTKVVELPPPTPPQELPPVGIEAPPHVRGTVESVKVKTGKKGEYAILVIADQGGSKLEVFCHKTPASCGVEDFMYLEDQEVFFTITESQVRDKTYLNIDELWLADVYAQAMAEAKQ